MEPTVCNNKERWKRTAGFTLVELMVALVIFMVIMLGLLRGEIAAIAINSKNVIRDEALRLAEEELNRLRGLQFTLSATSTELNAHGWSATTDITVGTRNGSTTFKRTTQIADVGASFATMKQIDVAVGYTQTNGGATQAPTTQNRQVFLSTIIVR